ncbi:MAG: hypothetical protein IPI57_15825 [Candidatus Competibacteraceae bacterium]|nr:hypothetical protein [Candidatus Competibacteraceae bacterium]
MGADEKLQDNDDRMRFIKWYEKSIHDARSIAKAFGGKALKGTAKQKEWAEKIRASKIDGMSAEDAELCLRSERAIDPRAFLDRKIATKTGALSPSLKGTAVSSYKKRKRSKRLATLKGMKK